MRSGSSAQMDITGCDGLVGVRRSGVSSAAHDLQELGLISYQRGRIEVIDRVAPERRVCECYGSVKRETDRLLGA